MAHALTPRYRWSLTALRLGIKERVLLHLTPAQYKKNWVHDPTETFYSFIKRMCLFFWWDCPALERMVLAALSGGKELPPSGLDQRIS
jgi:hypothetical protein